MITKERLKELIRQRGTIYWIKDGIFKMEIDLSLAKVIELREIDCIIEIEHLNYFCYFFPYAELTDNKEEAEWHREFGCIERTERLELPTWEEVSRDLQNVPAGNYVIKEFDYVSLEYIKYNGVFIGIYTDDYSEKWEATKENYTKACRKCKELFLGGKDA